MTASKQNNYCWSLTETELKPLLVPGTTCLRFRFLISHASPLHNDMLSRVFSALAPPLVVLFVDLPARVVGLEVGPFSIVGLWVGLLLFLLLAFVDFEDLLPRAVGMRVGWFVFFALLLLLPRLLLLLLRRASILVGLGVLGLAVGMYEG